MFYYIHKIYGYMVASEPPQRNLDQYTEITKEEYEEYIKQLEKENNNGTEMPN